MARPCTKVEAAAEVIRNKILHGDHMLHGIPGERQMSKELGISRETLRRAIGILEDEGLLLRLESGRLAIAPATLSAAPKRNIGFLKYTSPSHDITMWQEGVHAALDGQDCALRTVGFEHYGDASISAALNGFDAVFFLPPAEKIPNWLSRKMRDSRCRVVVLDQNATDAGLPSVVMFPPQAERKLLEHLRELGSRRIDCLSTQARDPIIEARIATWRAFLSEKGLTGKLHQSAEFHPVDSAYRLIKESLRKGTAGAEAVVCTTGPAALGAMRAFYDAGIKVGRNVSVCAVNDEGLGPYLTPSLTCLQSPPRALYLQTAVQWIMAKEETPWSGALLVEPLDVPMFIGDSTGPVQDKSPAKPPQKVAANGPRTLRVGS